MIAGKLDTKVSSLLGTLGRLQHNFNRAYEEYEANHLAERSQKVVERLKGAADTFTPDILSNGRTDPEKGPKGDKDRTNE